MVGPRGWILVIGLLVFLAVEGDFQEVAIGDLCCIEDWDPFLAEILKAYKTNGADMKNPTFLAAFKSFMNRRAKVRLEERMDICGGDFAFECEGTKNSSKCVCNKETQHVPDKGNRRCMAQGLGSVCMAGSKNCLTGTCEVAPGESFGDCKVGGVDKSKSKPVVPNGVDRKSKASYIQRPIMWVIIGGLALVSSS